MTKQDLEDKVFVLEHRLQQTETRLLEEYADLKKAYALEVEARDILIAKSRSLKVALGRIASEIDRNEPNLTLIYGIAREAIKTIQIEPVKP